MFPSDVIQCFEYLFNELIETKKNVSIHVREKFNIENVLVRGTTKYKDGSYLISLNNNAEFKINNEEIKAINLIRFDVISDIVTTYQQFQTSFNNAQAETGKLPYMIHFMKHNEDRSGGFYLTVKISRI